MAKKTERKAIKRGKASFTLIGKAKITDKTFNLNNSYDSGWTDNQMYIGIDCGMGNIVYSELRGGFFPNRDNILRGYSKDNRDENGKSDVVEIAWEDRLDESLIDTISDSSFINVGVEKDTKGKTLYKKFLSEYDAVDYLNEHLEDGTIVNVKGNIKYSEYDGIVSAKKEITSIVLSRVEDESDFKATFSQTILLDYNSIGKKDSEKNTMALDAYVVDYVGSPKINGKKIEIKKNICFPKMFEVAISDNAEITAKMLQRYFKVKKKNTVNELTVVGNIVEGGSIVTITKDDIPDDIKELIDLGVYSEEEATLKCAVNDRGRERRMVITKPDIIYVGKNEEKKPTVAIEEGKYTDADLYFYEQALEDAGVGMEESDEDNLSVDEENSDEDDLLKMLDDIN